MSALPQLKNPKKVVCSDCGTRYIYGAVGRRRYFDRNDDDGTVRLPISRRGSPCCGKEVYLCGGWSRAWSDLPVTPDVPDVPRA